MAQAPTINRRQILGALGGNAVALALAGCGAKEEAVSQTVADIRALNEFLKGSKSSPLSRADLDNKYILYDIENRKEFPFTCGRAIRITQDFFLTAYHTVDEDVPNLRLVPQSRRGYAFDDSTPLSVVKVSERDDLALLRAAWPNKKASIHQSALVDLGPDDSPAETLIQFLRLSGGKTFPNAIDIQLDGKDFYDMAKESKGLCSIHLAANSQLLEERGSPLPVNEEKLKTDYGEKFDADCFRENRKALCTVLSYNGESGLPLFRQNAAGGYTLEGIVSSGYGILHEIDVPDHPLGARKMQQVATEYISRVAIRELVQSYLESLTPSK